VRVVGLDGRTRVWTLVGADPDRPTSAPHRAVREFIKRLFPLDVVVEELGLPGTKALRADFFLPRRRLVVEIHGRQHAEFVAHFHGDRFGFAKSLSRDESKRQWCRLNGLTLAELDEGGGDEQWRRDVIDALRKPG
jgi:hypothetical protein